MKPRQNCTICSDPAPAASSCLNPGSDQKISFTNLCQLFNVNVNAVQVEILLGQNQNPYSKFCDGCYADLNQVDRLYQALKVLLDKLAQIKVGFEKKILTCHLKGTSTRSKCKNAIVDLIIQEIRPPEPEPPETAITDHFPVTDSAHSYYQSKDSNKEIEPAAVETTGITIGQLSDLELKDSNEGLTLSTIAQDIIVKKSTCNLVNNEVIEVYDENDNDDGFANDVEDMNNEVDGQENEGIEAQIYSLKRKKRMNNYTTTHDSASSESESDDEIEIIEDDEEWQPEETKRRKSSVNEVLTRDQIKKMKTECLSNQAILILNRLPPAAATATAISSSTININEEKIKGFIEFEKCQLEKIANLKKNRYKCQVCGLKLINDSYFQEHILKHSACNLCTPVRRFTTYVALQHHHKYIHTENPPKIVQVAGVDVEHYICSLCNKELKSFIGYVSHYERHKKDVIYKCLVFRCGKQYYTKSELCSHMRTKHPDEQKDLNHSCKDCGRKYKKESDLKNHTCPSSDRYKCKYCFKGFATSSNRRLHEKRHEPHEHLCEICSCTFVSIYELRNHISFKHNTTSEAEKVHDKEICSFCGLLFSKSYLEAHIKHQHTKEFNYFCQHCSRGFYKMGLLNQHIMRTHPPEDKIWKCTFAGCSKTFTREHTYKYHIRIHRPAKFVCVECDKHYFHKRYYNEHVILHHNRESIVPISCDDCGRTFSIKRYFLNHRKKCVAQSKVLKNIPTTI